MREVVIAGYLERLNPAHGPRIRLETYSAK